MPNKINESKSFAQLLDDFQDKCDGVLEDYIRTGYLKTFAGLLSYMSHDRAQKILLSLDQDTRQKIEYIINHKLCNPNLEAECAFAISKFAPLEDLAEIEKQRRREADTQDAFATFAEKNPIYADYLKKMHFSFNEILMLDDRAVQKVLREVDCQVLVKALKNADEEIRNKFFRNLSKTASDYLREDLEFLGPVPDSVSLEAQAKISLVVLRLEEYGEIVRNYNEDFDLLQMVQGRRDLLPGAE